MRRDTASFHYDAPEAGSIMEEIEKVASDRVPIIGAFQNLAADRLSDLDDDLEADVTFVRDETAAKHEIETLTEEIIRLRTLDRSVGKHRSRREYHAAVDQSREKQRRDTQPQGAIRITTSEGLRTLPCPFHAQHPRLILVTDDSSVAPVLCLSGIQKLFLSAA